MIVTYSDKAKQCGEEYVLLQQATMLLEGVLGPSASLVTVEWDRREDSQGRILYPLRLSDWTGAVSASFAPDELRSPSHMRVRLYRLWGDLLQVRNHKLLQEMAKSGD